MASTRRRSPALLVLVLVLTVAGGRARAQSEHVHTPPPAPEDAWTWAWDASIFFGWNYQYRKFTDFQRVESQNWFMGSGEHKLGEGRVQLRPMLSLEPLTIQALGSPQVVQTGETYKHVPLIDYQHPHDFFMELGATFTRPVGRAQVFAEIAPVGSPALGPTPFMHRPSAEDNPSVPLSHHQMDATHITHGVVTGGVTQGD